MKSEQMKQSAYTAIKEQLDKAFEKGGIPNIKAFKKIMSDLRKRINLLESGTPFFARSLEDVESAELQIARLSGQLQAYKERMDWINERMKSCK